MNSQRLLVIQLNRRPTTNFVEAMLDLVAMRNLLRSQRLLLSKISKRSEHGSHRGLRARGDAGDGPLREACGAEVGGNDGIGATSMSITVDEILASIFRNQWLVLAIVGLLLLVDDLTQYWWHRLSHSPLLWPLHRAHHSAEYMSIRVTFRNNFF